MIAISGIFGYIGTEPCDNILFDGINALKNRGFESAGIATQGNNELLHYKLSCNTGPPKSPLIKEEISLGLASCGKLIRGSAPCAVTRPATNNLYAVAVDGTIGNFYELKKWCDDPFPIITDEDLILAMLCVTTKDEEPTDKLKDLQSLAPMLQGDVTFAFICNNQKAIYCSVGAKPLVIGMNKKGFYLASELSAISETADKYLALSKGEIAKITKDKVYIYDCNLKKIKKSVFTVGNDTGQSGDYSYSEQLLTLPSTTKEVLNQFVKDSKLHFEQTKLSSRLLNRLDSIILTGAGSSYNIAGIIRCHLELLTDIPVWAIPSGELRHNGAIINSDTLVIPISTTGESTDTILSAIRAKELDARVIGICCNKYSQLSRICDYVICPDVSVSSSSQSMQCNIAMYFSACLLSLYISNKSGVAKDLYINVTLKIAEMLSGKILTATKAVPTLTTLASRLSARSNIIITGLGADYPLSLEASAALNNIAKINSGTCRITELITRYNDTLGGCTIIVPITNEEYLSVVTPHLLRARTLGAEIIILTLSGIEEEIKDFDNIISFNDSIPLFNPMIILSAIYKATTIIEEINNSNRLDDAG